MKPKVSLIFYFHSVQAVRNPPKHCARHRFLQTPAGGLFEKALFPQQQRNPGDHVTALAEARVLGCWGGGADVTV